MGSFRSKEDVSKISTSIYVTNFPDSISAKELFHTCKQYGHVVDAFIPTKRSKDSRFIRENKKDNSNEVKKTNNSFSSRQNVFSKAMDKVVNGKSFVNVVKGNNTVGEKFNSPAIVLDDDCINRKDLSFSLMGRVLEISSLANLKKALCNEGFDELKITYLGELWVMLEFVNNETKESFWGNVGAKSWFSVLKHASLDFIPDGRMAWVEIDGIPFKFWSDNTFKHIAAKWGELMDMDDYDETGFHSKRLCIYTKVGETDKVKDQEQSFQYPPGFTPNAECNKGNVEGVHMDMVNENVEDVREDSSSVNKDNGADNLDSFKTNSGPTRSGWFKKSNVSRCQIHLDRVETVLNSIWHSSWDGLTLGCHE
ncbi:hypothetical protein CTI12_AA523020 [Artemisia annua]|uniref:RRM domain-containing protein n=1 Tax=Artemisia annua TaxID=35608 RepID=A0A2U1L762_ARTAN|nr:hypothetical protein CTI12_AA523020 [Artemisia annua]